MTVDEGPVMLAVFSRLIPIGKSIARLTQPPSRWRIHDHLRHVSPDFQAIGDRTILVALGKTRGCLQRNCASKHDRHSDPDSHNTIPWPLAMDVAEHDSQTRKGGDKAAARHRVHQANAQNSENGERYPKKTAPYQRQHPDCNHKQSDKCSGFIRVSKPPIHAPNSLKVKIH
jgi:hypothetical protein